MVSRIAIPAAAILLIACVAAPATAQRPTPGAGWIASHADSQAPNEKQTQHVSPLERRLTLRLVDVPLARALEEVAREAGLTLAYSPDLLPSNHRISLDAYQQRVTEVLESVLQRTNLGVRAVRESHVTLVRLIRPGFHDGPEIAGSIAGRVTNSENGGGLAGANVRILGTDRGTLTRQDGSYVIEVVPAGPHRVVASLIGYRDQSRPVEVVSGETAIVNMELAISALELDQVVVTGTLVPTQVRAIPTPISLVTAAEIENRQIQRVDEIFRGMVPGAVAWDVGANNYYTSMNIRGKSSFRQDFIKTYIDGVEVADPVYIATIDPASIERIEVIRGPQASTLYGTDAAGGVMQIFTKKGVHGLERPQIRAGISAGIIQSRWAVADPPILQEYSLAVEGGDRGFSYNAGATAFRSGEFVAEASTDDGNAYAGVRATQGPLTAELSARYSSKTIGWASNPLLQELGYLPWTKPRNEIDEVRQSTAALSLSYAQRPNWQHNLVVGIDGNVHQYYLHSPRRTTPADTFYSVSSLGGDRTSLRYSTSVDLSIGNAISSSLTAGIEYGTYNYTSLYAPRSRRNNGTLDATFASVSRITSSNIGYFLQDQIGFFDRLYLTAGARVEENENFGEDYGRAFAPRLGVAYSQPLGALEFKLRSSWGSAIRSPEPRHKQESSSASTRQLANLRLAPERQVGWDAGVEIYSHGAASLGITHYDQLAIDLIDWVLLDVSSQPVVGQYQNVGEIRNRGWEMEGSLQVSKFSLSGTYSMTHSTVEKLSPTYTGDLRENDSTLKIPSSSGGLSLGYAFLRGGASLDLTYIGGWTNYDMLALYGWIYGGDQFRGSLRNYWFGYEPVTKLDLRLQQALTDRFDGFMRIENLTNQQLGEGDNQLITAGRTFVVGAEFTY